MLCRRLARMAAVLLAVVMALAVAPLVGAPASGAEVGGSRVAEPFTLDLVEGELLIRDAEEPFALTNPTSVSGTNDTDTGAITGGTFTTPQVEIQQDITSPLPATVFITADFAEVTPNSASGTIDHEGNVTVQTSLSVDLHIDVQPPGGGATIIDADCTTSPVNLTLSGAYNEDTDRVTLVDDNFSIPEVTVEPACSSLVTGEVNNQLAGPGHSLSMTLEGVITPPQPPGCPTATALSASPVDEADLGDPVDLTATVSIPDPNHPECLEAAANGDTTEGGLVDFFDGDDLLGTAPVQADGTASVAVSSLPAGLRSLSAAFKPFTPFNGSVTEALPYRVTPNPAITSDIPEFLQIGAAAPTEFDVTVTNTGLGRSFERGRLDISIRGALNVGQQIDTDRVVLEYLDSTSTWVTVPLVAQSPPGTTNTLLWGAAGDVNGFPLAVGEAVTQRLRIQLPNVGSTAACGGQSATTCPGPFDFTFEFIEIDEVGAPAPAPAPAPDAISSSSRRITFIEAARRPSDITIGATFGTIILTAPVEPHTVRQGGTVTLNSVNIGPNDITLVPQGFLTFLLDGEPLGVRRAGAENEPPDADPLTRVPIFGGGLAVMFDLPANARLGSHIVTVRYGGDPRFLPTQTSVTFTVVESTDTLFDCLSPGFINTRFRAFVAGQANVPSVLPVGSSFDLEYFNLSMKFSRERTGAANARSPLVTNNTTRAVGTNGLGIDLGFGPDGSGTGASLSRTNGTPLSNTPNPATNLTTINDNIVINGPSGSINLDGAPGDIVPITVDRIHLTGLSGTFPVSVTCTPVSQPLLLGEVTASGNTLTVEPGGPVREGDEVSLISRVEPYATGQVEFRDGSETVGVVPVVDGVARFDTTELPAGVRSLTAVFTGGLLIPPLVSDPVALEVVAIDCPPLEEGNGAIVRLVYMELLLRCPDASGYAFWKGRLDGGLSAQAFAELISGSDEAVGHVVNDAYQTMLGRNAEPAGKAFWVARLQDGGRYDDLLADLAASGEFWDLAGGTNEGFVERVYQQLLGRAADPAGLAYWTARLDVGESRRTMVIVFANLDEPLGRLVGAAYDETLDRLPSASERSEGIDYLRATGNRSGLYAQLIGTGEFADRADTFPNFTD